MHAASDEPGVVLWHAYTGARARRARDDRGAAGTRRIPTRRSSLVAVPYDSFADKLTSAIPRGNGPDLFIYAARSHRRLGRRRHDRADRVLGRRRARRSVQRRKRIGAMAYRGSLWGLPLAVKSLALFYRTDLVATPPTTTDELIALAPTMQRARRLRARLRERRPLRPRAVAARLRRHASSTTTASSRSRRPRPRDAMTFARKLVADGVAPADAQDPLVASAVQRGQGGDGDVRARGSSPTSRTACRGRSPRCRSSARPASRRRRSSAPRAS